MKIKWASLSEEEVRAEIEEVVGRVYQYFEWRARQYLMADISDVRDLLNTPLALTLIDLFDHVRGVRKVDHIQETCQSIAEALFVAPGHHGSYEIPEEFWETVTGTAIKEALGGSYPPIKDRDVISGGAAAKLAGVSRQTISDWRETGVLKPVGQSGQGGAYRYRAGDVRRAARSKKQRR